ncbi:MAG: 2-(1,2-epoxy-1,2-dihydrophenyl)acetyl-CoA isomerase [Bacteroidetes bacterium]|nr:MAG: 2-(1,2-epoxy-1,2-dihydrophenyl)acetyl-CoA isomerase [Bacteroidota bacterium]
MSESIKVENKGGVRFIILNRPHAFNSFDREMGKSFQKELDLAAEDDSVRCLVITGEGRAFCAGQDLKEVTAPDAPDFKIIVEETYNASIRRIFNMRKPIIAAVNGVAAGAGANIAIACDLTIARKSASFIQAFSKIGLIPDSGGTWWLPRLVGMQRAKALAFFGNKLSADDAVDMGLIFKSVEDDAFDDEIISIATKVAEMPTYALGLTKAAFHKGMDLSLEEHLTVELDYQFRAAASLDYAEGVSSFLEKRSPKFIGK